MKKAVIVRTSKVDDEYYISGVTRKTVRFTKDIRDAAIFNMNNYSDINVVMRNIDNLKSLFQKDSFAFRMVKYE